MKKRVSFYTFGCRLNQSETAAIENSLQAHGYEVVDFQQPSDIVVVNTCTVTENGDADTRRLVNRIVRQQPQARIALVGCQAQVQREALAQLPHIGWVVGNQRKMQLADVFDQYPLSKEAHVVTPTIEKKPFIQEQPAIDRDHTRANIKIQDGCDFFCSFCEIPYARGRARSRVFDDIIKEVNTLASNGYQEIVITGINVGTYADSGQDIIGVIKAIKAINGVKRIRISSIEPTTVPVAMIEMMGDKLCRYLHLPLQSGDDEVLKEMQRKYTVAQYEQFILSAKALVKDMCLGTDIIVGFPSETEAHFERTLEFVRTAPIDYVHVFSYSPRHMAKSRLRSDTINPFVIAKRSQALRELSERKRHVFYASQLGTTQRVLIEQEKNGYWTGLTDHYIRVKIQHTEDLTNQWVAVKLTHIDGQQVVGELVHGV